MPDFEERIRPLTVVPVTPQKKGRPFLAWTVIVVAVLFIVLLHNEVGWFRDLARVLHPGADASEGSDATSSMVMRMQARYLVGAADWLPIYRQPLYAQARAWNTGPVEERLRYVVLAGELAGPEEAAKQLHQLESKLASNERVPTPLEELLIDILGRLYHDYAHNRLDAPSTSSDERARLRRNLGWFGSLALAPAAGPDVAARKEVMQPAHRTVLTILGGTMLVGMLGFCGLIALIFFFVFLLGGKLQEGFHCGSSHGSIYAETFALWMVLFLALGVAAARLPVIGSSLLVSGGVSLLSLMVLLWPVARGVPWSQVRWEVGLKLGRRPRLEPLIGAGGYAMAIPMVAVGLAATIVLILIQAGLSGGGSPPDEFSPIRLPSHPVIPFVGTGSWSDRIQVLLLASIIAPFVEEVIFRGVLYRHLREASYRVGRGWSVLWSATVTSFVFAVIHPQGLVTVPALMSVAYALTLLREWRGTLVPGIVTHGLHNGALLLFAMLIMGD
jgi:membrane protease YdiL (CAAX protease family)